MANDGIKNAQGVFRVGDRLVGVQIDHLAEVCLIPKLSPLLLDSPHLMGALGLRGGLIPIVDLGSVAGLPARGDVPQFAAILRRAGRTIGFAVDSIVDFAYPQLTDLQALHSEDADDKTIFNGGFLADGVAVSSLDVACLFSRPDVPTTPDVRSTMRTTIDANRETLLTFSAGGAEFAIDAIQVHSTVPRQEIDASELGGGDCLGLIRHQGWKIPVVDPCPTLGLGITDRQTHAEVVVLRFADEKLLSFAVNSINEIIAVARSDIRPSTPYLQRRGFLPEVITNQSDQQTHIIRYEALLNERFFSEFAALATRQETKKTAPRAATSDGDVHYERGKYLVFDAGRCVAAPVDQIVRILRAPNGLVRVQGDDTKCAGIFSLDGASALMANLPWQTSAAEVAKPFVLLVGEPGRQVGFPVDSIVGLKTSSWRSKPKSTDSSQETLVHLGNGKEAMVLPVVNLRSMANMMLSG